jgi:hypothetical protein
MSRAKVRAVYYKLVIVASSPGTEIWLGDGAGHLVQKEVGEMRTELLPGDCVVEFGLGTTTYPIHLARASRYTQPIFGLDPRAFGLFHSCRPNRKYDEDRHR